MKSIFELDSTSRDHLNRSNLIENHLWEIAKAVYPGAVIDPATVAKAKAHLLEFFKQSPPRRPS
ncbi:MAG: hypothetical protein HYR55_08485 [Acidobacteria bacterium]|nr:hypothetical protein [Acidobacteriota bacterium]MBI3658038.1 hypothetical protein [Acidobacteriota bacterium]